MSQQIYVVVGAKGGVGATLIATKLVALLPTPGERVIVDADLAGKRTLSVWYDVRAELDAGRVAGATATVKTSTGLMVMELARSYEDAFIQTAETVTSAIGGLPPDALIVVDAPQPFAATVRNFIIGAAKICVVTEPTLLGVGAASAMLAAMNRFGIHASRLALILNDARGGAELRRSDIETTLHTEVGVELPNERDRKFGKIFGGFAMLLAEAPAFELHEILRQSTAKPIGDPRSVDRNWPTKTWGVPEAPVGTLMAEKEPDLPPPAVVALEELKTSLHATILNRVDFFAAGRAGTDARKWAELRDQVDKIADEFLVARTDVTSVEESSRIRREVIEEALGLGPLESLLHEDDVTEIMVNGHGNVFIERRGTIYRTAKKFVDDMQVRLVIQRIIEPLGRRLDEASPMVDARLADGSRVNAIIEPLAIDGPTLTIRRFGKTRLGIEDLISLGALTAPIADFLRACVEARLNILVSGGTGSGKTTLLNALSSFIPRAQRILTIEDAAEIKLDQPHVVRLESRPPNLEGNGAVTIRDLVRNALRMRPDRIIVGECRGDETLDMLQAMNTGHDGSLTTVHANTPRDAIARIETMVLMSGVDLPIRAIREQTASALDLIVQVERVRDGSRRVTSISEVVGMEGEVVTMQDLVKYNLHGVDAQGKVLGEFEISQVRPNCLNRFVELGVAFDPVLFERSVERVAESVWA
jgi:pilus assembly protein CpaF